MVVVIPVQLPPEPSGFDARVRREGLAHLREQGQDPDECPPNRALFEMRRIMASGQERSCEYWQLARDDLREGYANRCVYSCFLIELERTIGGMIVSGHAIDHFRSIRLSPARLAYEWSNLRWAWKVVDHHKANQHIPDDHDPTALQPGAFMLEESLEGLLLVTPNPALPQDEQTRLAETVKKLGLNHYVVAKARTDCYEDFMFNAEIYDPEFMRERQPFVAELFFRHPGSPPALES